MLNVLLINPRISYTENSIEKTDDTFVHHPPLGYLYLAAAVRDKGFSVKIVDTSDNLSLKQIISLIKKLKPQVVGMSVVTGNTRGAYQIATAIKQHIKPKPVIVLGGHHVSCDPDIIKRYSCFDVGITGEGEITFPKVLDKIINKKQKLKNQIYKGELPKDLDKIPVPARDLIDFKKLKSKPAVSMLTSRGCPYNCIFCSRPAISRVVRYRKPKLVVKEMVDVYQVTGADEFVFQDDTFNMNRDHVVGICNEIVKTGYHFKWVVYGRFNLIDEELIKTMAEAGCIKFMFGVESGNEKLRNKIIGKGITDAQIRIGINMCWKYNIEPDVFLMLGFPTETKKELYDTVNFGNKFLPNMLGAHITAPMPGSYLWDIMMKKGEIDSKLIDNYITGKLGNNFGKAWPVYIPKGMTLNDLLVARAKAHRSFYLSPKYILKRLCRDFNSWKRLKEDIKQAYSIFRFGRAYAKK